jgi:hypothetical protein
MRPYWHYILSVPCPICRARNGAWCRNEAGKCIPPHRERMTEALGFACSPLGKKQPTRITAEPIKKQA